MDQEKRMRVLVEAYHASGMGLTKFAAIKEIDYYQLRYWVRKLHQEKATSPAFIQLSPSPSSPVNELIEINYPNGVKLKVPTGNLSFVSQLIRVY